ncbi:MAG: hypothetical protein ACI8XO_001258 [Verrucomicrobiales bacterium]|jgi:hypothetical protein
MEVADEFPLHATCAALEEGILPGEWQRAST